MRLAGFIIITRPVNSFVAGLAAIVAYLIDTGTVIPESLLLFFIVALITAAGNVINDFFDAEIDAINRPDRPIPSGAVSRGAARGFAITLFLAGILVSFFTNPLCIGIAIFNVVLLIAYAAKLKSTPFIGNIVVAYLSASIFLFGGALNGFDGMVRIIPVAAITFFAMVSRELLKDAEDVKETGQAGQIHCQYGSALKKHQNLPLLQPLLRSRQVLFLISGGGYGILRVSLLLISFIIIAALRALGCETPGCVKASNASTFLKAGMFASLVVFTLSAVFL